MSALIIVAVILVIAVIAVIYSVKSLVVICQPSEVVIFSGPKRKPGQRVGYQALRGGRGLRIPLIQAVDRLDLTNMAVEVGVRGGYTRDGVAINVRGVANVKVDGDAGLDNAVERLLGKSRREIERIAQQTLEGNLRGVLARLTPEEVNEDKRVFAEELIEEAEVDLQRLGLKLDTLKIQTVSDDVGYLDSIGRIQNAELIKRARIAEAERRSESAVNAAENLRHTRVSQIQAEIEISTADAEKRIVDATTNRPAVVAGERSTIESQIARAEAELAVQRARIEQVRLQLEADLVAPARAYRSQREAEARAAVATIRENGQATADGLKDLAARWLQAGESARQIFLLEKLRSLVSIMVGTVRNVHIDQITVVDSDGAGGGSTAGKVASLIEQLRSASDIDIPELLKGFGVGARAVSAPSAAAPARPAAPPARPEPPPTPGGGRQRR